MIICLNCLLLATAVSEGLGGVAVSGSEESAASGSAGQEGGRLGIDGRMLSDDVLPLNTPSGGLCVFLRTSGECSLSSSTIVNKESNRPDVREPRV